MVKTELHNPFLENITNFYTSISRNSREIPGVIGHGIDIELVARVAQHIGSEKFLHETFTQVEIAYCEQFGFRKSEHYAGHYAAKEAVLKSLGGSRKRKKTEIEIRHNENRAPFVVLSGDVKIRADALGVEAFFLSITHIPDGNHVPSIAAASCIAVGKTPSIIPT